MKSTISETQAQKIRMEVKNIHCIMHAVFFIIMHDQLNQCEKNLIEEMYQLLLQHEVKLFEVLQKIKVMD